MNVTLLGISGAALVYLLSLTLVYLLTKRQIPAADADFVTCMVKKNLTAELSEFRGTLANLSTVLEFRMDLLEDRIRTRHIFMTIALEGGIPLIATQYKACYDKLTIALIDSFMFLLNTPVSSKIDIVDFREFVYDNEASFRDVLRGIPELQSATILAEYRACKINFYADVDWIITSSENRQEDLQLSSEKFLQDVGKIFADLC